MVRLYQYPVHDPTANTGKAQRMLSTFPFVQQGPRGVLAQPDLSAESGT